MLLFRGQSVEAIEETRTDQMLRLHLIAGKKRIGCTAWHETEEDAHRAGLALVDALKTYDQLGQMDQTAKQAAGRVLARSEAVSR